MAQPLTTARPAEPNVAAKGRIAAAVEANRSEILDLSHRIHANPEPAFEERQAATWVAGAIRRHGYTVEHPAGSLETAVRGRLAGGRGSKGPRIAILARQTAGTRYTRTREVSRAPTRASSSGYGLLAIASAAAYSRRDHW